MSGVNKVILVARLGQEPETRYTPDGKAITTFSVATSETWNDKNTGEKKEKTEWHRIVTFNKLAEVCGEYLSKGKQIFLEGKLQTRSWEKDGVKRYTTEIVAQSVQFLGSKGDGGGQRDDGYQRPPQSQQEGPYADNPDDDIPFG